MKKALKLCDGIDFQYQSDGLVFNGNRVNTRGIKYCVNVNEHDGEKVGYFSFHVNPSEARIRLAGIFVEPVARSRGLSHVFINAVEKLGRLGNLTTLDTTKQKKPLVCSLLMQHGFSPVGGFEGQNMVYVGRIDNNDMTGVYFENVRQANSFERSNIALSQRCKVVQTLETLTNPRKILLGRRYIKESFSSHLK